MVLGKVKAVPEEAPVLLYFVCNEVRVARPLSIEVGPPLKAFAFEEVGATPGKDEPVAQYHVTLVLKPDGVAVCMIDVKVAFCPDVNVSDVFEANDPE